MVNEDIASKKIKPHEFLFIDDSQKHITGRNEKEGAINVGWRGLLVQSNLPVETLRREVIEKLLEIARNNKGFNCKFEY